MTLPYLDPDGFEQVDDRLGHTSGDQVLQQATRRIAGELRRASDFVGRTPQRSAPASGPPPSISA